MISHNFCHCLSHLQCFLQSSLQCGIATDTNTSIGTAISISLNHHPGICMNFQSGMGINMAISVEHYILQKIAKIRIKIKRTIKSDIIIVLKICKNAEIVKR